MIDHVHALSPGTQLQEYRLQSVLGAGGFGITYRADDMHLNKVVAIKEYLPGEFATRTDGITVVPHSDTGARDYQWGLGRFLDEARTLARFDHPHLNKVHRYFEANGTAYLVLEYVQGQTVSELLNRHGTLPAPDLQRLLQEVLSGLALVHEAGYVHRDLKPGNLMCRDEDGSAVVLDFGAARQSLGQRSKRITSILTPGYAPIEQYDTRAEDVGPWSDMYALGMVAYRCVSGCGDVELPDAVTRARHERKGDVGLSPAVTVGEARYEPHVLKAIDWAIQVNEEDRPQSVGAWQAVLSGGVATPVSVPRVEQVEPVSAPTPPSGKTGIWAKAAVAMMLLVLVGGGVYWWDQDRGFLELSDLVSLIKSRVKVTKVSPTPQPENGQSGEVVVQHQTPVIGGSAMLVVKTTPPDVEVLLNSELVGETPLKRNDLRAGEYVLTLRHPHYETVRLTGQTFTDDEVTRIERTLTRATGALTVVTEPGAAWVERGGERLADETPVTLRGLPVGPLTLTLGAPAYRSAQVEAEVPKAGTGSLDYTLTRIPYGTLTLELEPADAPVTLPDIEPRYQPGMKLPDGRHRVVVQREGYQSVTRTVEVTGDTRERIVLEVEPRPFTVATTPANATVRILNIDEDYQAGMLLAPGEYRVSVSASGYETREEAVSHETAPTRHQVTLEVDKSAVEDCLVEATTVAKTEQCLPVAIDLSDSHWNEVLLYAIKNDNSREIIQVLLNHGADPNVDSIDGTPLLAALYDGDMHLIRLLLEAGADPNLQFGDESPLGFALDMDNSREIVQVLLNHGADPNVCDDSGTPLIYTIDKSNLPAVRLLLGKGADPNLSCGDTRPLGLALDGNPDIVTELISAGADVNVVIDDFQNTPLHKVAEDGNVYLAKEIIQAGADVNAINKMGSTPLIMARTNKNHAVVRRLVRLLLEAGADPNLQFGDESPYSHQLFCCDSDGIKRCKIIGKAYVGRSCVCPNQGYGIVCR